MAEDRFEYGFNGIQALKKNLESAGKSTEEKALLISFLEEVLGYSVYKVREGKGGDSNGFKKGLAKTSSGN